jgi:hypothetical protein
VFINHLPHFAELLTALAFGSAVRDDELHDVRRTEASKTAALDGSEDGWPRIPLIYDSFNFQKHITFQNFSDDHPNPRTSSVLTVSRSA